MDVQKIREVIRRRNETHDEYDYGVEMCDKEEIQILSEDIPSTINYLQNQCTADESFGLVRLLMTWLLKHRVERLWNAIRI